MRPDWIDKKDFPLRVKIGPSQESLTYTFEWLLSKILKLGVDYREVFDTTSNADDDNFVYFSEPYRRLAIHFAVKWGE